MSHELKTPWYRFYDGVSAHLEYPDISMYEMLEASMRKHPEDISYNYFGKKKTYRQFLRQVDVCAKAFQSLGVNAGERVSICMPNIPEAIISFYALNKIGAVANMIHPLSSEKEIKYYLTVSESKYAVTTEVSYAKIEQVASEADLKKCILASIGNSMPLHLKTGYWFAKGRKNKMKKTSLLLKWSDFIRKGNGTADCSHASGKGGDVAAILYSGGTTGYPKGIELTNRNFNALAMQSFEACQCLRQKDKVLSIMPVFHGFGLGICIHTVQYFGGTCILLPQFSAKTFDKLLTKYKPNVIAGVPTLYEALLKNDRLGGVDLSFLKCVISGGDSLSVSLKKKVDLFLQEHGADIQIREGYGLTECVTGSCLTPMNYYREGSIGIPYPDTYYKIVKPESLEEVPYGEEGEILLSGPTVMKGYLGDEEENRKTLQKDAAGITWLRTGDLGYMDPDGFVYFKQRMKRMIISSGYNIYPQYIENIIDSHPKVLMSCAVGIPHEYKGEVVKAYIVPMKEYEPCDALMEEIKEYCRQSLAKYSWPYEYEFREELPKTLVGKIDYCKLKEGIKQNEDQKA